MVMSDVQLSMLEGIEGFNSVGVFDSISPSKPKEKEKSEKNLQILKIVFVILCSLLVVEALVYKIVVPLTRYPKIVVTGNVNYSQQEIAQTLYSNQTVSWFKFNTSFAASLLSGMPGIESVCVEKHFPDSIFVSVVEREAVAVTFVNRGQNSVPVQIDKNGVLFNANAGNPVSDRTIPIVSGLPVEHLTNGMRIPKKYRGLIEQIAIIRKLPQKYFAAISEICVVPKEYGNYELVLYPVGSHTKVLIDRSLTEEALQYMMVVLDIVKSLDSSVSEIDLRYGSVSYRTDSRRR